MNRLVQRKNTTANGTQPPPIPTVGGVQQPARPWPPLLLTNAELWELLRIQDMDDPNEVVKRLIAQGLRPCMFVQARRFLLTEVVRFLELLTDRYHDLPAAVKP